MLGRLTAYTTNSVLSSAGATSSKRPATTSKKRRAEPGRVLKGDPHKLRRFYQVQTFTAPPSGGGAVESAELRRARDGRNRPVERAGQGGWPSSSASPPGRYDNVNDCPPGKGPLSTKETILSRDKQNRPI